MNTYHESQPLRAPWLYLTAAFVFGVLLWGGWSEGEFLNLSFILPFCFVAVIFAVLFTAKLQLSIGAEGIHYRFLPFNLKTHSIRWEEVAVARLVHFSAFTDYGGWGIRYNFTNKIKAFIPKSGNGLYIITHGGKKRLFSISRPEMVKPFLPQEAAVPAK